MKAFMILDCRNYSKNIVDILKRFQQIGWDIYNPQGKVEYLFYNNGSVTLFKGDTKENVIMPVTIHPDLSCIKKDNKRIKTSISQNHLLDN